MLPSHGVTHSEPRHRFDPWRVAASRASHPSLRSVDRDIMADIAAGLAAVTVPWELRDGAPPPVRRNERVLLTPAYEAWIVHWPAGETTDLHDHGESAGAIYVVSGALDELRQDGRHTSICRVRAGEGLTFDAGQRHRVSNRGDAPATSVHVYSPPLPLR
jgi:mannose-6-phosphate isomerase-like protein (cupin superfamily)